MEAGSPFVFKSAWTRIPGGCTRVVGTVANVNDVTQAGSLVHGEESDVFADAGYQGVAKREEMQAIKPTGT